MSWLVAVLALSTTFNLHCWGVEKTETVLSPDNVKRFDNIYRIDLDRQLYCSEDCKSPLPIARVTPIKLWLSDQTVDDYAEYSNRYMIIDRQTGVLIGSWSNRRKADRLSLSITSWDGQCVVEPFTGFPKVDTKF